MPSSRSSAPPSKVPAGASALGNALPSHPTSSSASDSSSSSSTSRVRFCKNAQCGSLLLASNWDGHLRLYDASSSTLLTELACEAPALDCAFAAGGEKCIASLVDGRILFFDADHTGSVEIGRHEPSAPTSAASGVKCVEALDENALVATAGWDKTMRVWDARAASGKAAYTHNLPGKAFAMAHDGHRRLVVATSGRHVVAFDTRMGVQSISNGAEEERESALPYQTRSIALMPDGAGFALGSVEGRASVEYFGDDATKRFAFKCHRREEVAYPVNAVSFVPREDGSLVFATGGADGTVATWDGNARKRLWQSSAYPCGLSSLALSHDGSLLAVAASYTWERGSEGDAVIGGGDSSSDTIFVRAMAAKEVTPKTSKK
ncbi:cell cycle arrest protein BUB3 [Pycnococcus provasolii]